MEKIGLPIVPMWGLLLPLNRFPIIPEITVGLREVEIVWSTGLPMEHTRSGSDLLVRLDPGEEIHTSLKELADDLGFDAAAITSGIGRTRDNEYGYMDENGVYQRRSLNAPSELVSLSGNIARTEKGDAFTHIHCCWSDDANNVHAGHMFQATVHVVAEIHIRVMDHASMTRCPLAEFELLGLEFD
jgi:predicted DNA-binding protein with PD1-like motif